MIGQHTDIIPYDLLQYWFGLSPGAFHVGMLTKSVERQQLYIDMLERAVNDGVLKRYGDKRGWYIPVQQELEVMDLESDNAKIGPIDIWLPFEMSDLIEIYPGNIVIIAGAKDSGKSAISLNIAQQNRHTWDVHYFNSEMGAAELRKRLDLSEISIGMWQEGCTFYRRASNFSDAVKPGTNSLNIIDFLEIHDEFYAAGATLKAIHDRLKGAVAIVNIQKKHPGLDVPPLGGWRSLEVCRVCLSVDYGQVKIKVAKNWRDPQNNPKNKVARFKLVSGYKICGFSGWHEEGQGEF